MNRSFLFLYLLLFSAALCAQTERYTEQAAAIEQMLKGGNYRAALAQAEALTESGRQAQLPVVEAQGRMLLGRALTENPATGAKDRVRGIRELKLAAQAFRKVRDAESVNQIILLLQTVTGDASIDIAELPSMKARKQILPSDDSIEEASLVAIVSLQEKAITALNDSQLRQVIILERQQRKLDANAFDLLNDSLLLLQQERVIDTQQAEVSRQTTQRNLFLALALAVLAVLGVLYLRFRSGQQFQAKLQEQNKIITKERQRSEKLLLNILPVSVAAELKETGKATARRYESATVMFTDFKGFSRLAATLEPEALINLLDEAFRALDQIVEDHKLEKIKTIGDAYMCAGGLPEVDNDHAARTVRAALTIQEYLKTNTNFDARIGIHTGPVVAGVVGKNKFVYDIWGDTVNQASRLETAGEVGRVAISQTTKDALGPEFNCQAAGTFEAKNIGTMARFFVVG
jgi:class 3 adenylate cyclase